MAATFDPYHRWLGIPAAEQPPNYYRLLGITLFEHDPDVIDQASERQMSHLRKVASGPNVKDSQRLLNEVAAAASCLLDPARRGAYDDVLRKELAKQAPPVSAPGVSDPFHVSPEDADVTDSPAGFNTVDPLAQLPAASASSPYGTGGRSWAAHAKSRQSGSLPAWALPVGIGGAVLLGLIVVLGAVAMFSVDKSEKTNAADLASSARANVPATTPSPPPAPPKNPPPGVRPNPPQPTHPSPFGPSSAAPSPPSPPPTPPTETPLEVPIARMVLLNSIPAAPEAVYCARFSHDGRSVAIGGAEKIIRIWDSQTGDLRDGKIKMTAPAKALAYSPDGKLLVVGTADRVQFCAAEDARPLGGAYRTFPGDVNCLEYSLDGRYLAGTEFGRWVRVWQGHRPTGPLVDQMAFVTRERENLLKAAISPDNAQVALAGENGYLVVRENPSGKLKFELPAHEAAVAAVAFSNADSRLYSADALGVLCEWNAQTGQPLRTQPLNAGAITALAISLDGGYVLCGTETGTIVSWSPSPSASQIQLEAHHATISTLDFSPDGKQLLSASHDGAVKVWQWRTEAVR